MSLIVKSAETKVFKFFHKSAFFFLKFGLILCVGTPHLNSQIYKEMMHDPTVKLVEVQYEAEKYFDQMGRGQHTGYKQYKRWEYHAQRDLKEDGTIRSQFETYKTFEKYKKSNNYQKSLGNDWEEMGPKSAINTSTWSSHLGRITSIGLDTSNTDHIIVGSETGGIWKTLDEGVTWTPIFDDQAVLDIYSLAIHPDDPDIYFAGVNSMGIMKSIDGGATWSATIGVLEGNRINRILIHPVLSNIILIIDEWGRIYKSIDTGDNWSEVFTHDQNMYDLEFKPGDHDMIYASGAGVVLKSMDQGDNWEVIEGPWTDSDPLMIAVTEADSEYLYALQSESGGFGGLYLSTDGGNTFTTQSNDANSDNNIMGYDLERKGGQAPRDMDVIVSPHNKDEVHVAGIMTFRSLDAGVNWTQTTHWVVYDPLPFVHADIDIMIYHDTTIYVGSDGGFFMSRDTAHSFIDRSQGLGVRQFYKIGVSQTERDRVSGGSQDNGTGIVVNGQWYDWLGADGMETFVDWNNKDIVFGTSQFGYLYKSVDGGQSTTFVSDPPGLGNWVTPLEQDPIDPNTLYISKYEVYKSSNGGASWTAISNFNLNRRAFDMKVSPVDNDVMYVSFWSQLYKTVDGGDTWNLLSLPVYFDRTNYIALHPSDLNKIILTLSGASMKVIESSDGGVTWTDLTDNLPDLTANAVTYDGSPNDGVYLGMSAGIYFRDNTTAQWQPYMDALPNVRVTELEFHDNTVYAATYGRGLWKNEVLNPANCSMDSIRLGQTLACGDGTTDVEILIYYENAPSSGGIIVNLDTFPILGKPYRLVYNAIENGESLDLNVKFENDQVCTINETIDIPSSCSCDHPDYEALTAFYDSLNGDNWTNNSGWNNDNSNCDVCTWYGVECNTQGRVSTLSFQNNNLKGQLPAEIENLTELQLFYLDTDSIYGQIPEEIGTLNKLYELNFWDLELEGEIPSSIGNLANLTHLTLAYSNLVGAIPSSLMNLGELRDLVLIGNDLTGSLPENISNLSSLRVLQLGLNASLTGTLEPIYDLSLLENLFIGHTSISGELSDRIGELSLLNYLHLGGCNLSGPLPSSLGSLSYLNYLYLYDNQFSGCFPPELIPLCDQLDDYLFIGNDDLPGGGDWDSFCSSEEGMCNVVTLISPTEEDLIDNNCTDLSSKLLWNFSWSAFGDYDKYRMIIRDIDDNSILYENDNITSTEFQLDLSNMFIPDNKLESYEWFVIPHLEGEWQEPTDTIALTIEPVNTDCSGCQEPLAHNYNPDALLDAGCQTCFDGVLNGDETDIDCGGKKCYPCRNKSMCESVIFGEKFYKLDGSDQGQWYQEVDFSGITVDDKYDKLYWTEAYQGRVYKSNKDGTDRCVIVSGLDEPLGIDIDTSSEKIYVSEYGTNSIHTFNLNGFDKETIHDGTASRPRRIRLDIENDKMYWVSHYKVAISSSSLDGSSRKNIISSEIGIAGLDIDIQNQQLFYTGDSYSGGYVKRIDVDGQNLTSLTSVSENSRYKGVAVDQVNSKLYTISDRYNTRRILWNLTDLNPIDTVSTYGPDYDICISNKDNKLFMTSTWFNDIISDNLSMNDLERIVDLDYYFPNAYFNYQNKLYMEQWGGIYAFQDGNHQQVNFQSSLQSSVRNFLLHHSEERFYFIDFDNQIISSDFHGLNKDTLYQGIGPYDLTIDTLNDYLYFTDYWSSDESIDILRSNLDGSGVTTISSFNTGIRNLEYYLGKLYVSTQDYSESIISLNDDGSGKSILLSNQHSYDIAIDEIRGYLYYSMWSGSDYELWKMKLDGSEKTKVTEDITIRRTLFVNNLPCHHCYNGVKDGDEEATDCGGSCVSCDECENISLELGNTMTDTSHYNAQIWIKSDANIMNGSDITFTAGEELILKEGFEVSQGATAYMIIEDCDEPTNFLLENEKGRNKLTKSFKNSDLIQDYEFPYTELLEENLHNNRTDLNTPPSSANMRIKMNNNSSEEVKPEDMGLFPDDFHDEHLKRHLILKRLKEKY